MTKRLALSAIALMLSSHAVLATPPEECLAAPTRACVFDVAQNIVAGEPHNGRWARTLISIAMLQEELGLAQSTHTFERYLAQADIRDISPQTTRHYFSEIHARPPTMRHVNAPVLTLRMAELSLAAYARDPDFAELGSAASVSALFARAGDMERAFTLLQGFAPEPQSQGVRVLAVYFAETGDWASLDRTLALLSSQDAYDLAAFHAVRAFLATLEHDDTELELDPIMAAISNIGDANIRATLLSQLTVVLAAKGHAAEARAIGETVLENITNDRPRNALAVLAFAYAMLGDEAEMRVTMEHLSNIQPEQSDDAMEGAYALLWTLHGDLEAGLDYSMAQFAQLTERRDFVRQVTTLAVLIAEIRGGDLNPLLSRIPDPYVEDGLFAVMSAHIRTGNLAAALPLAQRLDELTYEPVRGQEGLYREFDQLLAEADRLAEALNRAYARGDALSLAMLARHID